ncbi:F-box only protein 15 [Bagarius yarrelli]|uniref:F-box only protein 15 n=1 Tax=Bagarius yarrelli TaxID=175774 RepID=A0A556V0D6_BAGYA|nr:F-box only protein 15 [Bagarius yarrelli]
MAAGRGQFLLSLRKGLENIQSGRHGENSRGHQKKKPARDDCSRRLPPNIILKIFSFLDASSLLSVSFVNRLFHQLANNKLPPEIILKVFSFLDALSLFSVSFVNHLFHQLANDNVMWFKLYSREVGWRKWSPTPCGVPDPTSTDVQDVQDVPAAVWKKLLFSKMGCQKDAIWRSRLRRKNLHTGMPEQTEQVLRSLHVVWEITLTLKMGKERVYEQSKTFFFNSAVTVCWSGGVWPKIYNVYSVQLHGVLGLPTTRPTKPRWRSLISKTVLSKMKWRYNGTDSLVMLIQFDEGITVGVWRGTRIIAFIMTTLHFHRLVEKSVLGSLFWYAAEKLSGEFVRLHPVRLGTPQKLTPVSEKISFPWKAGDLQGDIKNCCMVTVTVLDDAQSPVWCISSSAPLLPSTYSQVCETYDGEHSMLTIHNANGKLWVTLVWMQDLQLYFLIDLNVRLRVSKSATRPHRRSGAPLN